MDSNHDQLKSLPILPGVYQFKNKDDKIIKKSRGFSLKTMPSTLSNIFLIDPSEFLKRF